MSKDKSGVQDAAAEEQKQIAELDAALGFPIYCDEEELAWWDGTVDRRDGQPVNLRLQMAVLTVSELEEIGKLELADPETAPRLERELRERIRDWEGPTYGGGAQAGQAMPFTPENLEAALDNALFKRLAVGALMDVSRGFGVKN